MFPLKIAPAETVRNLSCPMFHSFGILAFVGRMLFTAVQ